MILVNTSSQPFVVFCLILGGIIYSIFAFFVLRIKVNAILNNIIVAIVTIFSALIFFTIIFVVNSGEMRLFTFLSYILGIYIGFRIINGVKKVKYSKGKL